MPSLVHCEVYPTRSLYYPFDSQDQLKHLAGSERVPIEAKHLDATNMFDPRFFIFLSNHGLHDVARMGVYAGCREP